MASCPPGKTPSATLGCEGEDGGLHADSPDIVVVLKRAPGCAPATPSTSLWWIQHAVRRPPVNVIMVDEKPG